MQYKAALYAERNHKFTESTFEIDSDHPAGKLVAIEISDDGKSAIGTFELPDDHPMVLQISDHF